MDTKTISRAYKTELDPTPSQRQQFLQHCGAARYVYNWGLARSIEHYQQTGKSLGFNALSKELTALKQTDDHTWLYDVSMASSQAALRNLDAAYKNFFRRVKNGEKPGFPHFKSKAKGIGSFKAYGGVTVTDRAITLPRIGAVKLKQKEYLPQIAYGKPSDTVRLLGTTVSEWAGHWYVAMQVEEIVPVVAVTGEPIAVHLGVRKLATTSDGDTIENPKALERTLRKMKREQQALSRKQKGSHNRQKQKMKVARLHRRIVNIRRDTMHKATTDIVRRASGLVLESWEIDEMMHNKRLARVIADASMGEFRTALSYKADWKGIPILMAEKGYASSRQCANCGAMKPEGWYALTYHCDVCGWEAEREQNAIVNLTNLLDTSA